jgi:hypothetical protein
VAQRTQGPSGLGYVLHNRMVVARQFPEAFRELRVQRIASSYRRLLDTLEIAAAEVSRRLGDGHAPRVVLLTPGPYSETYFEHAYLARYLGLPLVEGGDLTVRGDRLFLKTVEGLEPVHGLMRRLDDDWCDPLELRPDSALGVPGLLQAARAGTVVMANALGSAFLESPAVQGFLPAIARRLTGQELLLPSLPTWWCGEAAAWSDVRLERKPRTDHWGLISEIVVDAVNAVQRRWPWPYVSVKLLIRVEQYLDASASVIRPFFALRVFTALDYSVPDSVLRRVCVPMRRVALGSRLSIPASARSSIAC